jgi:hypothetical protein
MARVEAFDPTSFFLFLLPPIIFESGSVVKGRYEAHGMAPPSFVALL